MADRLRDGGKIFAGETKAGVNRVQDSTVVIGAEGWGRTQELKCFLAGVFSPVMLNVSHMSRVQFAGRQRRDKEGDME